MNQLEYLSNYIGLEEVPKSWTNCYYKAKEYFENKEIDRSIIKKALNFYNLTDKDYQNKCFECVDLINNDSNLKDIFFLLYYILFIDEDGNYREIGYIKHTDKIFSEHGNLYIPIILLLYAVDIHQEKMKLHNFDPEQIKYHIDAINDACTSDINDKNLNGIRFSSMVFASFYTTGRMIQVGRLQFELSKFDMDYDIYINDKSNQIKLEKENSIDRLIHKKGDYRIKIHIPSGNKLDEISVKESLQDSREFIKKYFKGVIKDDYIYTCKSWLLSPELSKILNTGSNIIKFQKLFYCIEAIERKDDFLDFIFGITPCNKYKELKEKTSLQKEIKRLLLNNQKLHIGYGILKPLTNNDGK